MAHHVRSGGVSGTYRLLHGEQLHLVILVHHSSIWGLTASTTHSWALMAGNHTLGKESIEQQIKLQQILNSSQATLNIKHPQQRIAFLEAPTQFMIERIMINQLMVSKAQ
eukprot:15364467-Ditylum_brightwellii.AAC.1